MGFDGENTDPMNTTVRCLVLACGNTLRSDDGVGPRLAEWAAQRFQENPRIRVIARQQWTPDLAAEIADADSVLFVDASVEAAPGRVALIPVAPDGTGVEASTHHLDPSKLLGLARALYGSMATHAMQLTIGMGSMELGESLSERVEVALPRARGVLEKAVRQFISEEG
jgi:hydrogenase maturation protease